MQVQPLFLVSICLALSLGYSSGQGIRLNVDESISKEIIDESQDTLQAVHNDLVLSERQLGSLPDSVMHFIDLHNQYQELSEPAMIQSILSRFDEQQRKANNILTTNPHSSLGQDFQLDPSEFKPALPGKSLLDDELSIIDSISVKELTGEKKKIVRHRIDSNQSVLMLKEKSSLFKKKYYEGLVAIGEGEKGITLQRFSPAIGLYAIKNLSLGLGPSFNFAGLGDFKNVWPGTGIRSFVKKEVFRQAAYLQFEDLYVPSAENLEDEIPTHEFRIGAGYLLPVGGKAAINVSGYYLINQNLSSVFSSPLEIRIGISSINKEDTP